MRVCSSGWLKPGVSRPVGQHQNEAAWDFAAIFATDTPPIPCAVPLSTEPGCSRRPLGGAATCGAKTEHSAMNRPRMCGEGVLRACASVEVPFDLMEIIFALGRQAASCAAPRSDGARRFSTCTMPTALLQQHLTIRLRPRNCERFDTHFTAIFS